MRRRLQSLLIEDFILRAKLSLGPDVLLAPHSNIGDLTNLQTANEGGSPGIV